MFVLSFGVCLETEFDGSCWLMDNCMRIRLYKNDLKLMSEKMNKICDNKEGNF